MCSLCGLLCGLSSVCFSVDRLEFHASSVMHDLQCFHRCQKDPLYATKGTRSRVFQTASRNFLTSHPWGELRSSGTISLSSEFRGRKARALYYTPRPVCFAETPGRGTTQSISASL